MSQGRYGRSEACTSPRPHAAGLAPGSPAAGSTRPPDGSAQTPHGGTRAAIAAPQAHWACWPSAQPSHHARIRYVGLRVDHPGDRERRPLRRLEVRHRPVPGAHLALRDRAGDNIGGHGHLPHLVVAHGRDDVLTQGCAAGNGGRVGACAAPCQRKPRSAIASGWSVQDWMRRRGQTRSSHPPCRCPPPYLVMPSLTRTSPPVTPT